MECRDDPDDIKQFQLPTAKKDFARCVAYVLGQIWLHEIICDHSVHYFIIIYYSLKHLSVQCTDVLL